VAYWWVNQGQTWQEEIEGEYLWAPNALAYMTPQGFKAKWNQENRGSHGHL
jgi:hypothetical protein